jgi:hypothetical protein
MPDNPCKPIRFSALAILKNTKVDHLTFVNQCEPYQFFRLKAQIHPQAHRWPGLGLGRRRCHQQFRGHLCAIAGVGPLMDV